MHDFIAAFRNLTLISLLTIAGCQKSPQTGTDFSALGAYIAAYVPEVIHASDPVKIRFADPAVPDSLVGTTVDKSWYQISPAIAGTAVWEDIYTFSYAPSEGFRPGRQYVLTFSLAEVYPDIEPEFAKVYFNFTIRPIEIDLVVESPILSEEDPHKVSLAGYFRTSERVDPGKAEQVIRITYPDQVSAPDWHHSTDGKVHRFTLAGIARTGADRQLIVSWDGTPIESPAEGSRPVTIPGLDLFKVTNVEALQDGAKEIRLVFSDFLDPNLNFTGLILLNGEDQDIRIRKEKHIISIIPETEISGEFTVYVDAAIRNRDGLTLREPESFRLSFEDIPPQVELLGTGNVVPHSGEVILPFKAVNLTAVEVEIFEIFENNVMQFLQYGELWRANGYESVGRVVGRHVIELGKFQSGIQKNTWNRYAIDLSQYTNMHPGSIYEVRIGFNKNQSLYACSGEDNQEPLPGPETQSLWHYYYEYSDYRYENRSNPCKREYYSADHFVRRNVLASNLGLTAKAGREGTFHVYVHDLRSTEAVPGCLIRLYDFQRQPLAEGRTDAEGKVILNPDGEPAFVIAVHGTEKGYLKVVDGAALSLSDFDVDGTESEDGMRGYIYCERDVWRPGDTIYLNFILQSDQPDPADHPMSLVVHNARGQRRYAETTSRHVGPIYAFRIPTSPGDPTGNWHAELSIGGAKFNKTLKVETIKPNRLKIDIDTDGPVQAWKARTSLPLEVKWLHGAPAGGLESRVELTLSPATTRFSGFSDFRFDDPARPLYPTTQVIFDGKVDDSGRATVVISHDGQTLYPGRMTAHFKTRVFEKGGDFSTDQFSAAWWPYPSYAGIAIPENRWGYQQLQEGADNTLRFAAVDNDGKGLPNHPLTVGVYHADWEWWWNQDNADLAQFNSAQHLGAFILDTLRTDRQGQASFTFKPVGYGLHLIRVCDPESGHCAGDLAYAGYFHGEDEGRSAAARLTLAADREKYAPGDPVQINIPSAPGSLVVVSLEKEDSILSTHAIRAEGNFTQFKFNTDKTMVPNVYAHVRLIQPHHLNQNDMPLRMYGVIPIMVEDPATRLQPVLQMPDELRPEQAFEITVREAGNRAMAYTIAVVDEGLLDLTRFETPDPWGYFFARQALGVRTWDLYDQVLGGLGGPIERILAIGGDGTGLNPQAVDEVNRFKPVVRHLGPFLLKAGATASHQITLPNYLGSVRAMVIAAANDAYGSTEKRVPVKSPVMLLATLPRVLSPGEEIAIPVNVFAMDDKVRKVDVSIRTNPMLSIMGQAKRSLSFDKQGDQILAFTADVAPRTGKGEIRIEAASGRETSSQILEIEIRNPNPYFTDVEEIVLKSGESHQHTVEPLGMPGTGENMLEVSGLFPASLSERLGYLIQYPYGCLEQTISGAFPQLYVGEIIELTPEQQNAIRHHVQSAISKIARYVIPSGGFAFWPGGTDLHEWTNSYTGHFLLEAKRAGYLVDDKLMDHWSAFQSARAKQYTGQASSNEETLNQAYRLYTLVLSGHPELGAMNRLRSDQSLPLPAKYLLAAGYALLGQATVARGLLEEKIVIGEYAQAGRTFGSETRDRALIVETLLAMGEVEQAWPLAKRIAEDLGSDRWYSTQTTAFSLIALSRIAGTGKTEDLHFAYRIGEGTRTTVNRRVGIIQIPLGNTSKEQINIENLMNSPLFVRVIRKGQPVEPVAAAVQNHLGMQVSYMDAQGKPLDPQRLTQGTDFVMSVVITNPGTYAGDLENLALQTIFPSGWEILNLRLDNAGDYRKSSPSDYQDVRDDRVHTFFDLPGKTSKTFRFSLNAAYAGRYVLPAVYCEAMYDGAVKAVIPGKWVEVVPDPAIQIMKASVSGE